MTDITHLWRIQKFDSVTSTNDEAKRFAENDEPEGLVIWAKQQTGGRGRYGRTWESPEGNLYISLLLRPGCDTVHIGRFGFAAALAVRDTVHAHLPRADVKLKWPNDVLVNGKKISGILLEVSAAENKRVNWLIIGIGLNVTRHPEDASYPSTSLEESGMNSVEMEEILENVLDRMFHYKAVYEEEGFDELREAWLEAALKGHLAVRLPDQTVEGDFFNIDDLGGLVLRLPDGSKKTVATGEVINFSN